MPRFARLHAPGAVVHVIARFVNREHRLASAAERAIILDRLPEALQRTDWVLHAYALMGSHLHLVMTAGDAAPERFLKSLLVSVARRLNHAHGRAGPVFSDRARTILVPPEAIARLVAYVHNNPVRAGVVDDAAATQWTSHRAWVGLDPAPAWLAVDRGLRDAGFDASPEGRAAFDAFVRAAGGAPHDPSLSGLRLRPMRAAVRAEMALPVEVSSPVQSGDRLVAALVHNGPLRVAARWGGHLDALVAAAARSWGCPLEEVRSRTHRPRAVMARRTVMVAGQWLLRRRVNELAAALTIADSSASRLLRRGGDVLEQARRIERELREAGAGACTAAGSVGA